MPLGTLKSIALEDALAALDGNTALVDLRPAPDYLDVHIPGSLCLLYEKGPGLASRARDCIPLGIELILLDLGYGDLVHAASSLRGKGYPVPGAVPDALNEWSRIKGPPVSTEVVSPADAGERTLLSVGDAGSKPVEGAVEIPVETLWGRAAEFVQAQGVAVIAGTGVRAALAVGILERAGVKDVAVARA